MRLIDANNIKGCAKYIKTNENFEPYIMIDDLVKLLDEQPTPYDVDAVVEQLENERKFWENAYNRNLGKEKARSYEHAIEIVKGGGVDAKTDS